MKKKNILFAHSSNGLAGGERVTELLFAGLQDREDYSLFLLHSLENFEFSSLAKKYGVRNIPIKYTALKVKNLFNLLFGLSKLCLILKKYKINIIHVVDPVAYRFLALAASISGVSIIFHHHYPYSTQAINWFFKGLKKPKAHVFCCKAISASSLQLSQPKNEKSKFIVVHNGIDLEKFTFTPRKINRVCDIGIVGNFQKRKGHENFISIASTLLRMGYKCRFHVYGKEEPGSGREKILKDLVSKENITKHVNFHGFVDSPQSALASLHILICASEQEAFPMNILEAMAKGVSVVSTDVDGIPEAIENKINGMLNRVGDIDSMVADIVELIENNEIRMQMLTNARLSVENQFSKTVFLKQFETVYENMTVK